MKLCGACQEEKAQDGFSKKQWQLKKIRRCKLCVDGNRALQMEPPASAALDNVSSTKKHPHPVTVANWDGNNIPRGIGACCALPGTTCWICLDDGVDHLFKQPITRDCACRGSDSGFAHMSCLMRYAVTKCTEKHDGLAVSPSTTPKMAPLKSSSSAKSGGSPTKSTINCDEYFKVWSTCPNCDQPYENELAVELGTACIRFMEEEFPQSLLLHVQAYHVKLRAYSRMLYVPGQMSAIHREEAITLACKILDLAAEIKRLKQFSAVPTHMIAIEANANMDLCKLYEMGGKANDTKKAIEYAKKSRKLFKSVNQDVSVMLIDNAISNLETSNERGIKENEVKQLEDVYHKAVKQGGENSMLAVLGGINYISGLKQNHYGTKAHRIAAKCDKVSRRVCGPEHHMTKEVAKMFDACKARLVILKDQKDGIYANALRYESDNGALLVRGPVEDEFETKVGGFFTLESDEYEIKWGNPVICVGLEGTENHHLNGKIGDVRNTDDKGGVRELYEVHFEDKELKPCWLSHKFVRILFDFHLPNV